MFIPDHDRRHIAWDIESTGFGWADEITVSGFWYSSGTAELIVNTDGAPLERERCESHLESVCGGVPVTVTPTADEAELLSQMQQLMFEKFDREYDRLVAFNAESWKNGFDLPFVRTSCVKHGVGWLFDGIEFADL